MKITEVRIFPTKSKDGRLKAYATMTFDDWFVVRNVKIIQGNTDMFVAMPSRKVMDPCKKCGFKNVRGSKFCNDCGAALSVRQDDQHGHHGGKRQEDHMDIAHPIRQACRVYIQEEVLKAFNEEIEKKEREGDKYKPATTDDLDKGHEEEAPHHPEQGKEAVQGNPAGEKSPEPEKIVEPEAPVAEEASDPENKEEKPAPDPMEGTEDGQDIEL